MYAPHAVGILLSADNCAPLFPYVLLARESVDIIESRVEKTTDHLLLQECIGMSSP